MSRRDGKRHVDEMVEVALAQGWRYRKGTKHDMLLSPDGTTTVGVARTRPGARSLANFRADLRRAGVKL